MKTIALNKLNVLLIDDDPITNFINARMLWQRNIIQVNMVENGQLALSYLEQASNLPDLIFLDLNMPVMDGFEFLKTISSMGKYKNLKILILTSSIRDIDKKTTIRFPMVNGYMEKPLDSSKLDTYLKREGYLNAFFQAG